MSLFHGLQAALAGPESQLSVLAAVAVVGVALALVVARLWQMLVAGNKGNGAGKTAMAATTPSEKTPQGFDVMGEIEPLTDLDWKTEKPERIYKFADKYNLTMGIRKTTINTITRLDQQYVERIEERKRIIAQYPGALGCKPEADATTRELYTFMVTHYLPRRYPQYFVLDVAGGTLHNRILDQHIPTTPPADIVEALRTLALTVDEDFLVLLPHADGDGYALQSFVWLYPVGFDPVDKMGLKLRDAHRPVPGYKEHLQTSMDRYFARLQPGRVVDRVNWAVATNAALCERGEYHLYADDQASSMRPEDIDLDDTWVRCELQTLFGLPGGGRVLSVHLYLYPLREIKRVGLAEAMVRATDGYGKGNAPAFARYKRTPVWGDVVKAYLRSDEDLSPEQIREKRAREAEEGEGGETKTETK